jgi:hypothetical protein
MEALRLRTKVKSDTLRIKTPELSAFNGKEVEIILIEDDMPLKAKQNYSKFRKLKGKIKVDEESIKNLREVSKL